jgi:ATP-dependent exoDNAse (exonuclease V) alpha subunit
LITVVGNLPEVSPGEHLKLDGLWDTHPKHGKQFKAEICTQALPSTVAGMASYLGSGMVKGIGPKIAERIVECFGEEIFEIIEHHPNRLEEVSGIGRDRMGKIIAAWEEQKQVKEIMVFLHAHGVSTNLAVKIYKEYGDRALQVVQEDPYQLERDPDNPLNVDFLVVDEASMLDLLLTNHLLKALRPGTHLLFVGDIDQLPSVGAGDVLRDLIESKVAAVTRLETIFRQAEDSQIITNAHRINQGQTPFFAKGEQGDFYLFPAEDAAAAADWVVDVVTERVPQTFGFDGLGDIQVLSPLYRGPAGVTILNERLQEQLNPQANGKAEKSLFGTIFRVGDKVMQTRNNYDKNVYNGDIGFVQGIDLVNQTLSVDFEEHPAEYEWSEADELTLAYAVSVHKAQGAEFPVVVMPVVTQHYMMLQRNLIYTAITRTRDLCVLSGNMKAIGMAVRNNKVTQRFSALRMRLEGLHISCF